MRRRPLALLPCLLIALLLCAPSAQARVPESFFGTMWDGEITHNASEAAQNREWKRMNATGVRSARTTFEWIKIQPARRRFDFTSSDHLVRLAARNDVELLPVVIYAPPWARQRRPNYASPPRRPAEYARFLGKLIRRYGPRGSFWAANPDLPRRPIRAWQIWNEPHLSFQWDRWSRDDWARDYGRLLRSAYRAVHRADPRARVVLAGLSNRSYVYLEELYRRGRIRGSFDVAALHPYTVEPRGVLQLTRRFREVMARRGDARRPLWITELGLPATRGRIRSDNWLQTTDRGMARFLSRSYRALAAGRRSRATRVDRVYWYTWASIYCCEQFRFSGLLQYDMKDGVRSKPALRALRAAIRSLR